MVSHRGYKIDVTKADDIVSSVMAEKSFIPFFTGEISHRRLYAYTPSAEQDPGQLDLSAARVLYMLDQHPATEGQGILAVRYDGAENWDMLPDGVLKALAVAVPTVRSHMRTRLGVNITMVQSETTIPEPHALLVPTYVRGDVAKLWSRTYDASDRASDADLNTMAQNLALPEELVHVLDEVFAPVRWDEAVKQRS